jgi:hypothetical protein
MSTDSLGSVTGAAKTSLGHTFIGSVTLAGADALGAKPSQTLTAKGLFDAKRGVAFERVDLPGPLDRNKVPPRDGLIFVPGKLYLAPAAQERLPRGRSEIIVPLAASASARFVTQAMALNPVLLLDEIVAGGTSAEKTGSEVIVHVPYTDYLVTVDLRRALGRLDGLSARAERVAIRRELAALGGRRTVQIAVRTDGAGFVRLLHTTVPGANLGRLTFDLHAYGIGYTPNYPTPAQTVTLASLAGAWGWSPHWPWVLGG